MRRSDSPQLQVCELACPSSSPRETTTTGKMQTTIGKSSTQQLLVSSSSTPTRRNHPYRFVPPRARQDSSPPPSYYTVVGPPSVTTTAKVASPAASSHSAAAVRRPQEDTDQDKQSSGLPAGTIVAILFSGLILIFLVTGVYALASGRSHMSRRDWRGGLVVGGRRRSHNYEDGHVGATTDDDDDDMEMQAPRHTRGSPPLGQRDESHRQSQYQSQKNQLRPYHHDEEGAGMGYDDDDDDGKEAWIEVGTAQVSRIRRVPAGSVAITNMGRRGNKAKAVVPAVGASQSVRDVFSLPDLAWAETLTTGGGRRRPGVRMVPIRPSIPIPAAPTASSSSPLGTAATGSSSSVTASATTTATGTVLSVSSSRTSSSVRSSKKGLQERSESRRAVKRKAIREWCARGSGGGLGPYSAAY